MSDLKDRICRVLADEAPLHWEALAAQLPGDRSDAELERAVSELQNEGRIRHSGRDGGFRLHEGRSPTVDRRDGTVTAEITVSGTVTVEIDDRRLQDGEE